MPEPHPDHEPTPGTGHRRVPLLFWAWIGYWALLFTWMHLPRPPGGAIVVRLGDKVAHGLAYLLLVLLGGWAAIRRGRPINGRWALTWGLIYAAYAAADELLQEFPGVNRHCSFFDWLADLAGIGTGLLILGLTTRLLGSHHR